jgi:hypothetical protein
VRLRLEGGVQGSPDPPSRRRLQRLLRMRARDTIGITARDTLCRHGRACLGHPDAVRRGASHHRDHRDEPGDDGKSGARCNVLTLLLTLCIIWTRPVCIPARRGARSRGVARVGRGGVLQQASHAC